MIKLIASDLDGTMLWGPDRIVRPSTIELIKELLAQGRNFIAASGRQYGNQLKLFAPVKEQISFICENGALIMHQGEIAKKFTYDRQLGIDFMKSVLEKEDCEVLLSGVHTCYIQPKKKSYEEHMRYYVKNHVTVVDDICSVEEPFLKISVYREGGILPVAHDWDERFGDKMHIAIGGGCWLDTCPLETDKGVALKEICKIYGVLPSEMLVLGDNYNDIAMFQTAGYPIAMEQAAEEVRKYAKETTSDVNDVLQKILEGAYD